MEWTQSLLVLFCVLSAASCQSTCVDKISSECPTTVRFQSNKVTDGYSNWLPLCNFWTVSQNTSNLKSKLLCNSKEQHFCLSFQFLFQAASRKALSVYVLDSSRSQSLLIWSFTYDIEFTNWMSASVPIQTIKNFSIEFRSRMNIAEHNIDVTNVKIEQKNCTLEPPSAAVGTTTSTPITKQIKINAVTTAQDFKTESATSKLDAKETSVLVAIIAPVATVTIIFVLFSLLSLFLFKSGKLTFIINKFSHNAEPRQETKHARKPVCQISPGIMPKDNAVCNDVAGIRNDPTSTLLECEDCYSSINDHTSLTHPDQAVDIVYQNVNNNPTLQNYTTQDVYSVVDKSNQCQGLQNQTPTDVYSQVEKTGKPQEESTATKKTVKQPIQETTLQDVYAVVNKPTLSAGKSSAEEHPVSQDVYACVHKPSA